jgi:hypothetical protein
VWAGLFGLEAGIPSRDRASRRVCSWDLPVDKCRGNEPEPEFDPIDAHDVADDRVD